MSPIASMSSFPGAKYSRNDLAALAAIVAAVLVIYVPGVGNPLLYDDFQLADGQLFAAYSSFGLKVRALSYGSFVWIQALAGDGWWKQRVANLAIHLAVVVALWGFYREILRHIVAPYVDGVQPEGTPGEGYERSPAFWLAIGWFALNPVAVYAVAYLIQRSILLCTLFVVLGLWLFARGLAIRKPALHVLALVCYALALMSKEYAIFSPLAALPVYILVARPDGKRLLAIAAAGLAMVAAASMILVWRYGEIIGKPFDEYSLQYLAQLGKLNPDAVKHAYPLSIINQAYLFFEYGLRWFLPWTGWMSINMRPPFPITWLTFPQILGTFGYAATIAGGFFMVFRYRDGRALIGVSLLLPALLFATEFATVWVQDPFVLYRSYLWAIGVPGIVFFFLHGPSPRTMFAIGIALGCLLVWQSMDRVISLSTPTRAFSDAIEKLPNDPRSVGRWFPYVNRGAAYLESGSYKLAERDFESSAALGDGGIGAVNIGMIRLQLGDPREALAAFDEAERQGLDLFVLPQQRGVALAALGKLPEAHAQFVTALKLNPTPPAREFLLLQIGRTSLRLGRKDEAIGYLERLLAFDPANKEARYVLAMAFISKGEHARALAILDKFLAEHHNRDAFYARALAYHGLKRKKEAKSDIDTAIRLGLDKPVVREWQAKIEAMP